MAASSNWINIVPTTSEFADDSGYSEPDYSIGFAESRGPQGQGGKQVKKVIQMAFSNRAEDFCSECNHLISKGYELRGDLFSNNSYAYIQMFIKKDSTKRKEI